MNSINFFDYILSSKLVISKISLFKIIYNKYGSAKLVLKIRKSSPLLLKKIAKNTHYEYLTLTKKSQNNTQIKTWPQYLPLLWLRVC